MNRIKDRLQKYIVELSENQTIDQDGYLICENCILGRSGYQDYVGTELGLRTNDIISVSRREEDIFNADSLSTLEGRPFTYLHPSEDVNIDNYNELAKGNVFNVHREENNIVGNIRVTDKNVKQKILNKEIHDLSLGYSYTLVYDEEKQEYFMTDLIYNHVALVPKGRAGNARIKDNAIEMEEKNKMNEKDLKELIEKIVGEILADKKEEKEEKEVEVEKKEETEKEEVKEEDACSKDEKTEVEKEKEVEVKKEEEKKATDSFDYNKIAELVANKINTKETDTTKTKWDVNKVIDNAPTADHCKEMQKFYDSFDPHNYGNNCLSKEYLDMRAKNSIPTNIVKDFQNR